MRVLFCNIAYMNQYLGRTEEDIPRNGGSWVTENQDAHEKWNFLNYNGYCYGFVMNKGNQFHIERIDDTVGNSAAIDDVTVVWCASKEDEEGNDTVIVGWYEKATVYREYQMSIATAISGLDRDYFVKAKSEDCYLLPENLRNFTIERAARAGKGRGFGQSNVWYADSAYAQKDLIPRVLSYFEQMKHCRVNRTDMDFRVCSDLAKPLSSEEKEKADLYYDGGDYYAFLPYGYRNFEQEQSGDAAYWVASALKELHQFDSAIEWFKKVLEIEGNSWEGCCQMPYLYMQCTRYEEALTAATNLLTFPEAQQEAVLIELYSIIADCHYFSGHINEAISWLDRILDECTDSELLEYTRGMKEEWLKLR